MSVAANPKPTISCSPSEDQARLVEAHVNPRTGLASDYLNHFNEAIMLLEIMPKFPDCIEDFFAWKPKRYAEHFAASPSKYRDVTLAAYADADPELRLRLDSLADSMNEILTATREVMRREPSTTDTAAVADLAVRWVKPLVARAGAVINGTEGEHRAAQDKITAAQSAVDALMER